MPTFLLLNTDPLPNTPISSELSYPHTLSNLACNQCDQIFAIFHDFGQILKVFGTFVRVYLVFGKIVNLFWQIIYDIEQIFTVIGKRSNIEIII